MGNIFIVGPLEKMRAKYEPGQGRKIWGNFDDVGGWLLLDWNAQFLWSGVCKNNSRPITIELSLELRQRGKNESLLEMDAN